MPTAKDDFEDRLAKYRDLIQSLSASQSAKSVSSRSVSQEPTKPLRRRIVRRNPPQLLSSVKNNGPSFEVSGFSLQRSMPENPPQLQLLSRSSAASSRRRLISNTIRSQELETRLSVGAQSTEVTTISAVKDTEERMSGRDVSVGTQFEEPTHRFTASQKSLIIPSPPLRTVSPTAAERLEVLNQLREMVLN
jgi:hypothetical protein